MLPQLDQQLNSSHGTVAYDTFGAGDPIILIHGTPSSSYLWRNVVGELLDNWEIYLYDLVGFGQSEMDEGQDVSLNAHGKVFSGLLDHWNLDQAHVVGHDYGAATALRAHLLHDQEFGALAILDGVVRAPWVTPFSQLVRENIDVFQAVPAHIHRQMLIGHLRSAMYQDVSESDLEPYLQPWVGDTGQPAYYRQVSQFDEQYTSEIAPEYSSISIPTLVGWGEHDEWIDAETGSWLSKQLSNSEFTLIPDAGHFAPEDNPTEVASVLDEFFSNVGLS